MATPLVIQQFVPVASVEFAYHGQHTTFVNTDDDLVQWTTQRTTSGQPGQWTVTLVDRLIHGHSWAQEIPPGAYVEIRADNTASATLPIRMRGFVTGSQYGWTIGQTGGPTRTIQIMGEDYTWLYFSMQIMYLWQSLRRTALKEAALSINGVGLHANWGVPTGLMTPREFIDSINQHVLLSPTHGLLTGYRHYMTDVVPDPTWSVTIDNDHLFSMVNTTIQSYQGPLWSLMAYYATPGLSEMFMFDAESGPIGTFRVAPFYNVDQPNTLADLAVAPYLPTVGLDPAEVSSVQTGYSDQEVANFFLVQPDATGSLALKGVASYLNPAPHGNPREDLISQAQYGMRPLLIQTPLLSLLTTGGVPKASELLRGQASQMATYLYQTQHANQTLASGTIQAHGRPYWMPGRYVEIPHIGKYYLQGVAETFQCVGAASPSWLATLSVVRGQVSSLDVVPDLGG